MSGLRRGWRRKLRGGSGVVGPCVGIGYRIGVIDDQDDKIP